ncbi:MAG: SGNH/GDSL hydrolase family protein [Thermoanaerobaculia bacterium]|nr:SGNH/GDSL hydrolase family protein [Thermoanaerobaculia bacterium]
MEPFDRLPFKWRPGIEFLNRKENTNLVQMNAWGFHDRQRADRSDSYRLLAFGDSFVEGAQMPVGSLFTSIIERNLRSNNSGVEFANAGVGGTGTAYQYLLFQEFFDGRIDFGQVVLFLFNGNDLPNNHPVLERLINGNETGGRVFVRADGTVYVTAVPKTLYGTVTDHLGSHSQLFGALHLALYRLRRKMMSQSNRSARPDDQSATNSVVNAELERSWGEALEGTTRLVEHWASELRRQGKGFSIVVIPPPHLPDNYGGGERAELVARLRALQVPLLELDFDGRDPYSLYSFDGQTLGHFNEYGHRLVAAQVSAWLQPTTSEHFPDAREPPDRFGQSHPHN